MVLERLRALWAAGAKFNHYSRPFASIRGCCREVIGAQRLDQLGGVFRSPPVASKKNQSKAQKLAGGSNTDRLGMAIDNT
jgi:hypothetical protein